MTTFEWNTARLGLHTQVFKATSERAALLLTHGYAEHLARYQPLIERLNGAGITVYAYDQRGHGRSGGTKGVINYQQVLTEHLQVRESLRGLRVPLFAFGHSAGGLVTAASVLQDPRGLQGVILSSPALLVGENESVFVKKLSGVMARLLPALPVAELSDTGISRLSDEVSHYQNDPYVYHGKITALTAGTMLGLSQRIREQFGRWRLPTLVIHGDADQLAAVEGSRRFAEQAGQDLTPRPAIEYHEIAGGYHELFNDEVREEVTQLTLNWLSKQIT